MTAREELAQSIATSLDQVFLGTREFGPATQDYVLADALLAEGWGKQRTVATVEELDALGFKATILGANGCPWVNDGDTEEPWCSLAERADPIWRNSDNIALPATVLYEPQP